MNNFFLDLYLKFSRSDLFKYERRQITTSLHLWPIKFLVFTTSFILVMFLKTNEQDISYAFKLGIKLSLTMIYLAYFSYCLYLDRKIFSESFANNKRLALYKIFFYGLEAVVALYILKLLYTILAF